MQFRTQEELLRYLGKSNDRNLIKRMIARGEIWRENWMYCIDWEWEERIEVVPHYFNTEDNAIVLKNSEEVAKLKEELEEAKVNAEYWEKECRRYWRLINNVISVCYRKLKGLLGSKFTMSEEEFREWVIEEVKINEENIN